ncbi:class III extradiol dioxygenase subunit beta [Plantactinospora sp. WMMB334]|uniref:class III extradiol dioxygenase subunit beta n=1 Tax=Plantactinospora sp. WMMB334 TaxID=3404119 RepID=UPI003B93CDF6
MAVITAGLATSHVPAIGAAIDNGQRGLDRWEYVFGGYRWTQEWARVHRPDVVIMVGNDHGNALPPSVVPTLAIAVGETFRPADEGAGPRPVPDVPGHPALARHLVAELLAGPDPLTPCVLHDFRADHGWTVPLSLVHGHGDEESQSSFARWPVPVVPVIINVSHHPTASAALCWRLGQAIRRAVTDWRDDLGVQVWSVGGMSHQLAGGRAGWINRRFDAAFLDLLVTDPARLIEIPEMEYVRLAGHDGVELVTWLIMRAAMGRDVRVLHRHHPDRPVSNTALGHLVLVPAAP